MVDVDDREIEALIVDRSAPVDWRLVVGMAPGDDLVLLVELSLVSDVASSTDSRVEDELRLIDGTAPVVGLLVGMREALFDFGVRIDCNFGK